MLPIYNKGWYNIIMAIYMNEGYQLCKNCGNNTFIKQEVIMIHKSANTGKLANNIKTNETRVRSILKCTRCEREENYGTIS